MRVDWSVAKSKPAKGSLDGASVNTSEKSSLRIDSGCTATLFLHRTGNAEQDENPKEDYQYRSHDKRKDGSQKSFDKIHNEVIFCLS